MNISQIIFHIDLNAFFASAEIAENPALLEKAVVVAHNSALKKSIILTANYEARKYGIKTTMMVREAMKLCPNLVVVEPKMKLYQKYSNLFFAYLNKITPLVEPGSIDEGFLDVSVVCTKIHPLELAKKIQEDLWNLYKLPCSIGIAPNKFLAKMASDMKKPMGITVLRKREIDQYLWVLPVEKMYGVGKKTAPRLHEIGILTIGDLAKEKNLQILKDTIGENAGESLFQHANGQDDSKVNPNQEEVSSVSTSHTFDHDTLDEVLIKSTLRWLSNSVSSRLEKKYLKAYTIGIIIKQNNMESIHRSKAILEATNDSIVIGHIVEGLLEEHYNFKTPLRLVGVFASRVIEEQDEVKQYSIFELDDIEKENEIHHLLTELKEMYGKDAITLGAKKKK